MFGLSWPVIAGIGIALLIALWIINGAWRNPSKRDVYIGFALLAILALIFFVFRDGLDAWRGSKNAEMQYQATQEVSVAQGNNAWFAASATEAWATRVAKATQQPTATVVSTPVPPTNTPQAGFVTYKCDPTDTRFVFPSSNGGISIARNGSFSCKVTIAAGVPKTRWTLKGTNSSVTFQGTEIATDGKTFDVVAGEYTITGTGELSLTPAQP